MTKFRLIRTLAVPAFGAILAAPMGAAPVAASSLTDVGAEVIQCTATLSAGFPGSGAGTCNGTATGVPGGAFNANFTYSEPCPPVTGSAHGTFNGNGETETFDWTRVGLVAVVTIENDSLPAGPVDGVAVALFVPTPPPPPSALTPPCSPKNVPQTADVIAIGAWV